MSASEPSGPEDSPHELETDEEQMLAFTQGSSTAFAELFARYQQPVFGFFRRRINDPARAEELTQDTFVAILRASTRYEPSALFRTYLYAIAYRILKAYRRKAAFRATFMVGNSAHREPSAPGMFDTDFAVRDAIGRLEPIDREILMLREFEQLGYDEIAAVLSLPINTVRSRLFRARTALRELLAVAASQPAGQKRTAVDPKERS